MLMIIFSYLIGSISIAYIIGNIYSIDLTKAGTRNPGATNVYKVIGPGWGLLTGMIDLLKGVIPTYLAKEVFHYNWLMVICVAFGAIIGHNWPLLNKFNGGRGLATSMGTVGVINLQNGIIAFILGSILTLLLRVKTKRDIRISYLVYPLFTALTFYYQYNYYILIYGLGLVVITGLRAWQLIDR